MEVDNMYDFVIRKEFPGYLVFDVNNDTISLENDISSYANYMYIDNPCENILSAPTQVFAEITDECPLSCKHCFNGDRRNNRFLSLSDWKLIIDKISNSGVFRVRITGGEPFCRSDINELLLYLETKPIRYSIYTNGTLLEKYIHHLKGLRHLACIRISIDGTKEINDSIRGKGVYDKAISAVKLLESNNIPCQINFTISHTNYMVLGDLAEELNKEGIKSKIHVGFIKIGGRAKKHLEHCFINEDTFEDQVITIKECIQSHENISEYVLLRPLYNKIYGKATGCPGGRINFVIKANGDVSPCGVLPEGALACGNLLESSLFEVWHSENMEKVRNIPIQTRCVNCKYLFLNCTGGCWANPYNLFGDLYSRDINCATYRVFCKIDI